MRDFEPRLKELSELEDGWYWNEEGKAPSQKAIDNVMLFFEKYRLYPTVEGGISLEVSLSDKWVVEIEFNNDGSIDPMALDLKKHIETDSAQ